MPYTSFKFAFLMLPLLLVKIAFQVHFLRFSSAPNIAMCKTVWNKEEEEKQKKGKRKEREREMTFDVSKLYHSAAEETGTGE
jgi:hypothetical protein